MNCPGGQASLQSLHTVSTKGVQGTDAYCQGWQDEHGRQLYTPVRVQSVPSATVPDGHAAGHGAHCTSAVLLQGLTWYSPSRHTLQDWHTPGEPTTVADFGYHWLVT